MKTILLPFFLFVWIIAFPQQNEHGVEYIWKTDTVNVNSSVESLKEFKALLPRDMIPPIDKPKFWNKTQAATQLFSHEPVLAIEINGEARAYPLSILMHHEIVNDMVGGVPVSGTYCPLCNAGIVFDRRLPGEEGMVLDFGVSGMLRHSDMVMWDRQTETWWQQFTGEALVGELSGSLLTQIPSITISVEEFFENYPEGMILSTETGHDMSYGTNPYVGYDGKDNTQPRLYEGKVDPRLPATERVINIFGGVNKIYPLSIIQKLGVINDIHEGTPVVIFHQKGLVSVLDSADISRSRDIGAVGVFSPVTKTDTLHFIKDDGIVKDKQTQSIWNITGLCIEGDLKGAQLERIIHGNHFAFAWFEFNPVCEIFEE